MAENNPQTPDEAPQTQASTTSSATLIRLDQLVQARHPGLSRAAVQRAIDEGRVRVPGIPPDRLKAALKVAAESSIEMENLPPAERILSPSDDGRLHLLYEDEHLLVFNKPAYLPMYPQTPGEHTSVANILLARYGELPCPPVPEGQEPDRLRAGIVHRLDRDTTGIVVCARTEAAMLDLKRQFRERVVKKTYLCVVKGQPSRDTFTINAPIERDPGRGNAVRINKTKGRPATTELEVAEKFGGHALLHAHPLTGRTHQIRVHLASRGLPILADPLYSPWLETWRQDLLPEGHLLPKEQNERLMARQALHAWRLEFQHPESGEAMSFEADLPDDMDVLLHDLRLLRDHFQG